MFPCAIHSRPLSLYWLYKSAHIYLPTLSNLFNEYTWVSFLPTCPRPRSSRSQHLEHWKVGEKTKKYFSFWCCYRVMYHICHYMVDNSGLHIRKMDNIITYTIVTALSITLQDVVTLSYYNHFHLICHYSKSMPECNQNVENTALIHWRKGPRCSSNTTFPSVTKDGFLRFHILSWN